jgi:hypothetical protein
VNGPKPMFRLTALLAFGAACLSTGCAFSNVHVQPPAPSTEAKLDGRGRGREIIVVAPFDDMREQKERCGMQMNGYRMDTADVVCDVPPGRWASDALAAALSREGYRVLAADAVPGPSTIVVHGSVKKLFLEPHDTLARTVEADFSVRLVVTTASGLHAERTFFVKGTQTDLASTEAVFQGAANDATSHVAFEMATKLGELLDRYPNLGAPQATSAVAVTNVGGER